MPEYGAQSLAPDFIEPPRPTPGSNALGLTGFILALVGLVTCGCLSPLGLIFSIIGMTRRPRGFAIAGLVISIVGMLTLAVMVVLTVMAGMTIGPCLSDGYTFAKQIETYKQGHNGALPRGWSDLPGTPPSGAPDPWGHPYHYQVDGGRVRLTSDGPDGVAGTWDDVKVVIDNGTVEAFTGRGPPWMR